jgi:hypothetical protein
MTLFLRKQRAHDVIEGRAKVIDWPDDDYAVIDGLKIGRIYRSNTPGGTWQWFLQFPDPLPPGANSGMVDTLDEAKAAIAERYREAIAQRY